MESHWVYFVQGGPEALIKIGTSTDVATRVRGLQNSCPVPIRLLAVMPGGQRTEAALHRRWQAHRTHGEWFYPAASILEFIDPFTRDVDVVELAASVNRMPRCSTQKLTAAQWALIYVRLAQGEVGTHLAREYGVSPSAIRQSYIAQQRRARNLQLAGSVGLDVVLATWVDGLPVTAPNTTARRSA